MRRTPVVLSRHVDDVNDVGGAVFFVCVAPFCVPHFVCGQKWISWDLREKNIEFKAKGADLMKLPGASRGLANTDTRSSRLRRIVLREVPSLCSL